MKTLPSRFIVIDDDPVNNMLCSMVIKRVAEVFDIQTFNQPVAGFEYLAREYDSNPNEVSTVLFLDINMPVWTGWDFLYNYDALDEKIKKQISIYMLSSSVDPSDKQRALENKNVVDYIVKPLTTSSVTSIFTKGIGKG